MQAVFVDVAVLKRFLVLGFPLSPLGIGIRSAARETLIWNPDNVRICAFFLSRYRANKSSIFFLNPHVRMAERSKAPDSRVELFLTGVFWSTNVGVGSNPTSDKRFSVIEIRMRNRAS